MTDHEDSQGGLVLSGLDGANPLGYLAALGTLRGLTLAWPERLVRLSWQPLDVWRPHLHLDNGAPSEEEVLDGLEHFMEMQPGHEALEIDDNLKIRPEEFRKHACAAVKAASPLPENRAMADFIAAWGCDATVDQSGFILDRALRTLNGAGHQHFLRTMRQLAESTKRDNLRQSLFCSWARQDRRLSLRWDPEDDRRYALQWRDPSNEETRTEWGANRLAYEALPLVTTAPVGDAVVTTGFSRRRSRNTYWTWPIWEHPTSLDTVRSLLALKQLQDVFPNRNELTAMGVGEVFRSQRFTIGRYRNFTPSVPVRSREMR